jgi:hypothetical protein
MFRRSARLFRQIRRMPLKLRIDQGLFPRKDGVNGPGGASGFLPVAAQGERRFRKRLPG